MHINPKSKLLAASVLINFEAVASDAVTVCKKNKTLVINPIAGVHIMRVFEY